MPRRDRQRRHVQRVAHQRLRRRTVQERLMLEVVKILRRDTRIGFRAGAPKLEVVSIDVTAGESWTIQIQAAPDRRAA